VVESKLKLAEEKSPEQILALVELAGTQKTLPSGKRTPPKNALDPG
jgi:hypothetical protein